MITQNRTPHFRRRTEVEQLLVGYLLDIPSHHMPGVDGLGIADVLRDYAQFASRGLVPSKNRLAQIYPEMRDGLEAFFNVDNPSPARTLTLHATDSRM